MDGHPGVDLKGMLVDGDELIFVAAKLIAYVTDKLLEQHFESHDACRAAVLVHHDCHLVTGALHLEEERADQLRLGREHRRSHGEVNGGVLCELSLSDAAEHVLYADDADDVVLRILKNGKAGMGSFSERSVEVTNRRASLEPDDLGTGDHHFVHAPVTELEDAGEEFRLFTLENAGLGALRDEQVDLFGGVNAVGDALSGPQAEWAESDVRQCVQQPNGRPERIAKDLRR